MPSPLSRATSLTALLAALASAAVYSRLPAQMTTHWSMDGVPNGWMPRAVGALFIPVLILVVGAMMRVMPRIDPRGDKYESFRISYEITAVAILLFLLAVHLLVLAVGLGHHPPIGRIVPMLIGALLLVMGVVLPSTRSNWMYGIRTPWTLSDDRVWERTHHVGGRALIAAGIVSIAAGALLPLGAAIAALITASLAAVIGPAIYSWFVWKEVKRS